MTKILYLYPKKFWDQKMSMGRVWYGEAMARRDDVELCWWGTGWDDYDDSLPLRENLKKVDFEPDIIWAYKPDLILGINDRDCPLFVCYNEAWWPDKKALREVQDCTADMVVIHHENDYGAFEGFGKPIFHIPHGAPVDIFYCDTPVQGRPNDFLLSGVQSREIYPLRARYADMAHSGVFPCKIRRHPGYRLKSHEMCLNQAKEYARDLKRSSVSLCCTSKHKYLLAKIVESMMAGCLVVTDSPEDFLYDEIQPHVITIDDWQDDASIGKTISDIIPLINAYAPLSVSARKYALENLSTDKYAERLLACVKEIL